MVGPLLTLGTFLLLQFGTAIWWASRISTEMRAVSSAITALSTKLDKLESSVSTHETAIAVIETIHKQQSMNGAHRG
jgi:hypothetical protein